MAWQKGQDHDGLLTDLQPIAAKPTRTIPFPFPRHSEPTQPNDCAKCKPIIDIDLHR